MPRVRLWMGKGGNIYHDTTSVVICKDKWTQQAESFCSEGYLFCFQWYPFENLRLKGNGLKKEPVGILPTQDLYIKETLLLVSKSNEDATVCQDKLASFTLEKHVKEVVVHGKREFSFSTFATRFKFPKLFLLFPLTVKRF